MFLIKNDVNKYPPFYFICQPILSELFKFDLTELMI